MDGTDTLGGSLGAQQRPRRPRCVGRPGRRRRRRPLGWLRPPTCSAASPVASRPERRRPRGRGDHPARLRRLRHLRQPPRHPGRPGRRGRQPRRHGDTVAGTVTHMANSGALSLSNGIDTGGDALAAPARQHAGRPARRTASSPHRHGRRGHPGRRRHHGRAGGQPPVGHDVSATLPAARTCPRCRAWVASVASRSRCPRWTTCRSSCRSWRPAGRDAGCDLPVDVPDTSAVTDVLPHNPVSDAVSASPVGGLADSARRAVRHAAGRRPDGRPEPRPLRPRLGVCPNPDGPGPAISIAGPGPPFTQMG